jgi:hypothetical protein
MHASFHAAAPLPGVFWLSCLPQHQTPGSSVRLHLKAGREVQDMYVFRNVSILGLTDTYRGGIAYRVSAAHTCRRHACAERVTYSHTQKQAADGTPQLLCQAAQAGQVIEFCFPCFFPSPFPDGV